MFSVCVHTHLEAYKMSEHIILLNIREQLCSPLPFRFRDETQFVILSSKHFYPLSHSWMALWLSLWLNFQKPHVSLQFWCFDVLLPASVGTRLKCGRHTYMQANRHSYKILFKLHLNIETGMCFM